MTALRRCTTSRRSITRPRIPTPPSRHSSTRGAGSRSAISREPGATRPDVECTLIADFFTQMRSCMNLQRVVLNEMILLQGSPPDPVDCGLPESPLDVPNGNPWPTPPAGTFAPLTTRDVLRFGTMNGAKALRLDNKTGSLTPGKEADIIILDATRSNVAPLNQVPGAVVSLMDRTKCRDRDRRGQAAQMEGAAARRRSATSAPAARGLARLRLYCGWHPAGSVPQQLTAAQQRAKTRFRLALARERVRAALVLIPGEVARESGMMSPANPI
jgi:Amidohydrolase family